MQQQRDASAKILTAGEQLNLLIIKRDGLEAELKNKDLDTAKRSQVEIDYENTKLAIIKAQKGIKEDQAELTDLTLKGILNLTVAEKLRYDLLTGQTTTERLTTELLDLQTRIINGTLLPGDRERLTVLRAVISGHVDVTTELDKHNQFLQIENAGLSKANELAALRKIKEEDVTQEVRDRITLLEQELNLVISITRTGQNYKNQSTASLQGVIGNLQKQLSAVDNFGIQIKDASYLTDPGSAATAAFLKQELANALAELAQRNTIQGTISSLGENAARSIYGDSLTDAALRAMQDSSKATASSVSSIQQMLSGSPLLGGRG